MDMTGTNFDFVGQTWVLPKNGWLDMARAFVNKYEHTKKYAKSVVPWA